MSKALADLFYLQMQALLKHNNVDYTDIDEHVDGDMDITSIFK